LCDIGETRCSSDCMAFLKYELLSQPCFSGELYKYARAKANPVSDLSTANEDDEGDRTEIADWAQFYDIVDFCLHNSCGAVNVRIVAFLLTLCLITRAIQCYFIETYNIFYRMLRIYILYP